MIDEKTACYLTAIRSHQEEADDNDICVEIVDVQPLVDDHDHQGNDIEYSGRLALEHLGL